MTFLPVTASIFGLRRVDVRILAVDPGEKNIGLALSDPFGMTAAPLCIVRHKNRMEDAQEIARIAQANSVDKIIVGQALNSDGQVGSAAKHARKVAKELRRHFNGVVLLGMNQAVPGLCRSCIWRWDWRCTNAADIMTPGLPPGFFKIIWTHKQH